MVIKNLSTRTARTSIGHLPEVVRRVACTLVVADTDNALDGHTDLVLPNAVGFVVFLVNGDPKLFFWQTVNLSQQSPGKSNGITLEVVAETEVAQHFKERVVTCRIAHVFEVVMLAARTNATLR